LGEIRCAAVTQVCADAAPWIAEAALHCPDAVHVVAWAGDALDQLRRDTWNAARKGVHAGDLKGARYALRKNPENVACRQQAKPGSWRSTTSQQQSQRILSRPCHKTGPRPYFR
jgi:transposase